MKQITTLFILLITGCILQSCASTGASAGLETKQPQRESALTEPELAIMHYSPDLGHYYTILRERDWRMAWLIVRKQIERHNSYNMIMDFAGPKYTDVSALFIKDLITEDNQAVRRIVLSKNGKYMLLSLAKEAIEDLTSPYQIEEADYIFETVYNMAHLVFTTEDL